MKSSLAYCGAILSGVLLGCAFPPVGWSWGVWVGLAPLLIAIERTAHRQRAWLLGYLAGLVFFLITLHPLVSAYTWAGWASETPQAFTARMQHQGWALHALWVLFAAGGAIFWGWWAYGLKALAPTGGWRVLLLAPSLWVLLPEWGRAQGGFGFTWACLGNAAAGVETVRQVAALGGVWLLSALIIIVNVGAAHLLLRHRAGWWKTPLVALGLLGLAWTGGAWYLGRPEPSPSPARSVAVLQYHQARYTTSDFLEIGLDRGYAELMREALRQSVDLVVLPESVTIGAVSLDETLSVTKPLEWQHLRSRWDAYVAALVMESPTVVVMGLDTVERGRDYNTLVAWTAAGPAGWYHKRRLVPFAEYHPNGWGTWVPQGRAAYHPGQGSQLIRAGGLVLGGFICQEVLLPWVARESVRDGATVLVSGGNDGVFGDPAVAEVHAEAARLRAVEAGRDLIRAMKTGVSAIIDRHGREIARSRSSATELLLGRVREARGLTPFVRFGNWVIWLAGFVVAWAALSRLKWSARLDRNRRHQV